MVHKGVQITDKNENPDRTLTQPAEFPMKESKQQILQTVNIYEIIRDDNQKFTHASEYSYSTGQSSKVSKNIIQIKSSQETLQMTQLNSPQDSNHLKSPQDSELTIMSDSDIHYNNPRHKSKNSITDNDSRYRILDKKSSSLLYNFLNDPETNV